MNRKQVKHERQREKAEEVRALRVKQQKARMQKRQEEDEIQELMKEVESRRENELRSRIEREAIKKEIRDLDSKGLEYLEEERKRELKKLAKEKEVLLAKEKETLKEIEMLEKHVMEQEMEFREQQKQMEASLQNKGENTDDRKEIVRQRHMQMSKERGEQAAKLKLKREKLHQEQKQINENLKEYKST